MSDDELDRLFSESAEKIDFDFDPDSWTKMTQKLDEVALPPSSGRSASPWPKQSLLLLIGLLAFIGGYFLLNPSANLSKEMLVSASKTTDIEQKRNDSKKYVETSKVDTDNLKTNKTTTETIENTKSANVNITTKAADILVENDKNSEIKKSIETKKSIEKQKIAFSNKMLEKHSKKIKNNGFLERNNDIRNNSEDTISSKVSNEFNTNNGLAQSEEFSATKQALKFNRKTNESQASSNSVINSNVVGLNNNSQTNNSVPPTLTIEENRLSFKNLGLLSPKGTFIKPSINLPIIAFESPQKEKPVVPKSSPQSFKKGLYFRFGVSPDMSLITMNELTKFGSNLAFLLEYRFNNRLSIQGGVLRSMKHYDAYPESYEWPYNWPSPPKLVDINATCKMLDIPVNIRYDISQRKLSRFFVSAGATSYIMLNEKYVYNYENPADPEIKWKSWEGKTGPYYLGVLNFSMGYEYQLFRKLSLQAEPFFKLPISQVGFGQVNLSTLGLLVSAKYPISIRK